MWTYVIAIFVMATSAGYYYTLKQDDGCTTLSEKLEYARINAIVDILDHMAERRSTDEIMSAILQELEESGISEKAVLNLSTLHKKFGSDNGTHGYAINLIWSTVIHSLNSGKVVIIS